MACRFTRKGLSGFKLTRQTFTLEADTPNISLFLFLIFLNNNAEHVVLQIIADLASVLCRNSFDN